METREQFVMHAQHAGWDRRRIDAYVTANQREGLPYPDRTWTSSDLQKASDYAVSRYGEMDDDEWDRAHPILSTACTTIGVLCGCFIGLFIGFFNAIGKEDSRA